MSSCQLEGRLWHDCIASMGGLTVGSCCRSRPCVLDHAFTEVQTLQDRCAVM